MSFDIPPYDFRLKLWSGTQLFDSDTQFIVSNINIFQSTFKEINNVHDCNAPQLFTGRESYRDSDGLSVANEVALALPSVPFNDLGRGAGVVHRVGRHDVLAVR